MAEPAEARAHVITEILPGAGAMVFGLVYPNDGEGDVKGRGSNIARLVGRPHRWRFMCDMSWRYRIDIPLPASIDCDVLVVAFRVNICSMPMDEPYPRVIRAPLPSFETIEYILGRVRESWRGWLLPIVLVEGHELVPLFMDRALKTFERDEHLLSDDGRPFSFLNHFPQRIDLADTPWNRTNKRLLDEKIASIARPAVTCRPLIGNMPVATRPIVANDTCETTPERIERLLQQSVVN